MGKKAVWLWAVLASLAVLAGCGTGGQEMSGAPAPVPEEAFSFQGTVFTYDGTDYDMTERSPSITTIVECTPVRSAIVIEGHVGPKNAWYSIFDTESRTFINDFAGCHLIWRDGDITSAVYSFWSDVLDYDGNVIASVELDEGEFIYDLAFQDDGLAVTIVSDRGGERTVLVDSQ